MPDDVRAVAAGRPLPWKNVRRRRAGCRLRSAIIFADEAQEVGVAVSASVPVDPARSSLSWHQALLLPRCVRRNSSPASSIGTPWDSSSVAIRLRACRRRSRRITGSSVGPSTPQFQLKLSFGAVAVVLAVGLVVLLVVADQVAEREAVVAGDEVDRVDAAGGPMASYRSALPHSRVARSPDSAGLAAPEAADVVAVTAVPLRPAPAEREMADLVQPARVPRLGDQLGVGAARRPRRSSRRPAARSARCRRGRGP